MGVNSTTKGRWIAATTQANSISMGKQANSPAYSPVPDYSPLTGGKN